MERRGKTIRANPGCSRYSGKRTSPQTKSSSKVSLALHNPLILTKLFQVCPVQQLAPLRLVCKEWHQLSLPFWRANLPVTLSKNDSVITLVQPGNPHPQSTYTFENFLTDYSNNPSTQTDKFPHRFLKLLSWHCDPSIYSLQGARDAIGNNILTLELNGCTFPRVEDFRKLIYHSCPQLRNLRIMKCRFRQFPLPEEPHLQYAEPVYGEHHHVKSLDIVNLYNSNKYKLPVTWLELFSHFPSLTNFFFWVGTFKFNTDDAEDAERFCDGVLKAIETVREHDCMALPFKTFAIRPGLEIFPTGEKVALLRKLRLPIYSPMIRLHLEPDMDDQWLRELLQILGRRLWSIQLIVKKGSQVPVYCNFPCEGSFIRNLSALQFSDVLAEDMSFLKYTPKLQFLQITDVQYQDPRGPCAYASTNMITNTQFSYGCELFHLTHLVCNYVLTKDDTRKLAWNMPNMEKAELILDDQQFEIVCENWKKLKGLKVLGRKLTDKGIAGLNMQGMPRESWQGTRRGNVVAANITNLKHLVYLSLWSNSNLTVLSVYEGFLKLPKLRRLQICPEPESLGVTARNLLRDRVTLMGLEGDIRRGGVDD